MGCLKLSYYQTYSNRKVLYSECVLEPKTAQIWLSVDPMSDKYPSMSPYNYCANNPVILVDPDGRWIKGAGLLRNIFRSDAYCVSYLAATSRGLPSSSIEKVGKNHYNVSWMSNDGYSIYDENGLTSRISLPTFNIMSIKIKNTLFKFNLSGVAFYNNSSRDRPGPDRKTNQDVNMVDISNFPTGTGSSGAGNVPELIGNMIGLFERGGTIAEAVMDYNQAVQNQKNKEKVEASKNRTVIVEYPYLDNKGNWSNATESGVPLKDSAATAAENTKKSIEANR